MAKPASGPTWALLSPSSLPSADDVPKILGAIVPDYEYPARNAIPQDASTVLPKEWFATPTQDGNFKVALDRASGKAAYVRLGDILKAAFSKSVSDNLHLTSTTVWNYTINQENKAFKLLKKNYKYDILDSIKTAPPRNRGSVFAIVAIKTCQDAELSSQHSEDHKMEGAAKVPIKEAAAIAGAPPLPIIPNPEGGVKAGGNSNTKGNHVAKGARIFAVQYRVIKKRKEWRITGRPKLPPEFEQKDLLTPAGPAMYGEAGQDVLEELEEDEDDDGSGDDEALELGDLEHTWSLSSSEESGVVMTTL